MLVKRVGTESNPADYFTKPIVPLKLVAAISVLTRNADGRLSRQLNARMFSTSVLSDPLPDTPFLNVDCKKLQSELPKAHVGAAMRTVDDKTDRRPDDAKSDGTIYLGSWILTGGAGYAEPTPDDGG
jgi:hypothetical protein